MKRWSLITAAAVVAAWLVVDTVRDFIVNDTIQYFSSAPHRLLYVVAIAITGGMAALLINRLSPGARRRLKLFSWGTGAGLFTAFWSYMLYETVSTPAVIIGNAGKGQMVLVLLLFAVLAAYLWFEFYRTWKTRVSQ